MRKGRNVLLMALAGFAVARVVARARNRQGATRAAARAETQAALPSRPIHPQIVGLSPTREPSKPPASSSAQAGVQPRELPSGSHLAQLHFGRRGAGKNRRRRAMARLGIVALIASLLGLPGVNLGLEFLGDRLARGEDRLTRADLRGVTTSESAEGMMRLRGNMFQSRPTPTPTPTQAPAPAPEPEAEPVAEPAPAPPPAPAGSVTEILYTAAAEFGIDGAYLVAVASCESGLNPGAVNPAGYHGLFQFAESTWASYGYGSIYDPTAQARTAARMLAAGMSSQWPNCA